MDTRYTSSPIDVKNYDSDRLRQEYLIDKLFEIDKISMTYSHFDRIIVATAVPVNKELTLDAVPEIRAENFCDRREIGIINIGGAGIIIVDGVEYKMDPKDGLYIGMGSKKILFKSIDKNQPSEFYINSAPAHKAYPTAKVLYSDAEQVDLGSIETSNERTIHKYFHPNGLKTCQLVMGMTELKNGSVWNSMPTHTHERRMEVYMYFNLKNNNLVFHFMGQPNETRHIVMRDKQAVISPSWSIHCGSGTSNYTFIWGMCGENQTFNDMDNINMGDIK